MPEMTKDLVIEIINRAVPYSEQITKWDTSGETDLRFTWRGDRYRVHVSTLSCETAEGGMLVGGNLSILMERLLKLVWAQTIVVGG